MDGYPVSARRGRHVVSRLQEKIEVRRTRNRAHEEVLLPSSNDRVSAHRPVRRGRRRVKRNRLVRRRLRRVDVKEERLATSGAVQLHGVGDCEVTGAGLGTQDGLSIYEIKFPFVIANMPVIKERTHRCPGGRGGTQDPGQSGSANQWGSLQRMW